MVIDELIVRKGTTNLPIDSFENGTIDEIFYKGKKYHFAKQNDVEGETEVVAYNAVEEPMRTFSIEGNTSQQTYTGKNLIDVDKLVELILGYDTNAFLVEVDGRSCIKYRNSATYQKDYNFQWLMDYDIQTKGLITSLQKSKYLW